jgi:hypothetical protein
VLLLNNRAAGLGELVHTIQLHRNAPTEALLLSKPLWAARTVTAPNEAAWINMT